MAAFAGQLTRRFTLNNFVDNSPDVLTYNLSNSIIHGYDPNSPNAWDNGVLGNYWSDYQANYSTATKDNALGTWNSPYVLNNYNIDHHPIVSPLDITYEFMPPTPTTLPADLSLSDLQVALSNDSIAVLPLSGNISASQMSNITLTTNPSENSTILSFTVTGQNDTYGFCNITIAKAAVPYGKYPSSTSITKQPWAKTTPKTPTITTYGSPHTSPHTTYHSCSAQPPNLVAYESTHTSFSTTVIASVLCVTAVIVFGVRWHYTSRGIKKSRSSILVNAAWNARSFPFLQDNKVKG